jgi:hypothetical protein
MLAKPANSIEAWSSFGAAPRSLLSLMARLTPPKTCGLASR